jgi:hypothetical protein
MTGEGNQPGEQGFVEFPEVSDAVREWALGLRELAPPDFTNGAGVYGMGRAMHDIEATTVIVGQNTDLSDKTTFPDEVDGTRIVYWPIPAPERY